MKIKGRKQAFPEAELSFESEQLKDISNSTGVVSRVHVTK